MDSAVNFVVYPFLFLALFFEVFAILTVFEKDARVRRQIRTNHSFPFVSIIVPCYNEASTIKGTTDSLLAMHYPKDKFEVILVDDGSTDDTARVMTEYANHPQVVILRKENGGKHTALNAGIAIAKGEFVGCMDADSFVTLEALERVMANFDHENIGAVTSSMSVASPNSLSERMQEAEYLFGILMRHSLATVNGLYVTPGPFTIYRKRIFDELGPFTPAHQTEDMEIALRMQRAGWKIQNAPNASVFTKAPTTVWGLIKQRTRWTTGFLRNGIDYRDLLGNPKKGVLGLIVLPMAFLSVFSGLLIMGLLIWKTWDSLFTFSTRALEVPLSYTLSLNGLDWFYFSIDPLTVLSIVAVAVIFTLIIAGAHIAEKKIDFGLWLAWYFLIYSAIAAVWQFRAVADVVTGNRRSWR